MRIAPVAAAALLCWACQAVAETVVLDDSRSPRQQLAVQLEWAVERVGIDTRPEDIAALKARIGGVEYRLDTSAFVGRRASIYLLFPRATPGLDRGGSARLSWATRGVLSDGAANQGDRALVFQGEIDSALMVETFDFTIHMDARDLAAPLRLAPEFVLETE